MGTFEGGRGKGVLGQNFDMNLCCSFLPSVIFRGGGGIGVADYAITPKNPANYAITPTADYAITPKHPGNYAITPKYRPDYAIMPIKA